MSNYKYTPRWRNIKITWHAQLRLRERVGSYAGYRDWQDLVKTARYTGRTPSEMTSYEYLWCSEHIADFGLSAHVRILNGFAYIFKGGNGHARCLITVIKVA